MDYQEKDKKENKKDNNYNYYNNRHTEPGVSINREAGERIVQAFTQAVGPMNYFVAQEIEKAVQQGLTVANVLEAIQITSFAPRPSAAYLRAVLRNWIRDGVSHRQAPQKSSWWQQNPALNYEQREYRNEDFEDDSFIEIAKAYLAKEGKNEP